MAGSTQENSRRYKINEINQERHFKIPKELFTNPLYKHLNSDAKLLYAILKDRMELSRKNGWVNENGEIYLIYTREDLMDFLGVAKATIVKLFKQLKEAGLIDETRPGQGHPNRIFINHLQLEPIKDVLERDIILQNNTCETLANSHMFNPRTSDVSSFEHTHFNRLNSYEISERGSHHGIYPYKNGPNDTEYNDTEYNESVSQSSKQDHLTQNMTDGQTDVFQLEDEFKNQIGYDDLITQHDKPFVDEIVLNMMDMYYSESVKVNGNIKPQSIIKSILAKVNHWHILHVIERFNGVGDIIKNKKEYLQTMIYNSVLEMDTHLKNFVNNT